MASTSDLSPMSGICLSRNKLRRGRRKRGPYEIYAVGTTIGTSGNMT